MEKLYLKMAILEKKNLRIRSYTVSEGAIM